MKIKNIQLKNYRSIKDAELTLSKFNVLIGKNNSGKSNVQKSIADYRDLFLNNRKIIKDFKAVVAGKDESQQISLDFHFSFTETEYENLLSKLEANGLDTGHRLSCENKGWFSELRHKIAFAPDKIVENELLTNYQNEWVTVSELRKPGAISRLKFDGLPDNRNIVNHVGNRDTRVKQVIPDEFEDIMAPALESWEQVSAFRQPRSSLSVAFQTDLNSDGQNLVTTLNTLSQNEKSKFTRIVNTYTDIMEAVTDIRTPLIGSPSNPDTTVEIDEKGFHSGFPLQEISAGSKEILVLITKIVLARDNTDLLLIEEPELHLHPAAEQRVFDLIRETATSDEPQILMSTHSEIFVNNSHVDNIMSVKRDRFTTLESIKGEKLNDELEALGYDNSDFLQADSVVFVEGRSDKVILQRFAESLGKSFDRHSVEAIVVDGDELKADTEPVIDVLRQLRIPYLFALDSDKQDPAEKASEINEEVGISPEDIHVLEKFSIESYLMDTTAIARAVGEGEQTIRDFLAEKPDDTNMKGVLDDLFQEFLGTGYHEEKHGAMIAKHIDDVPDEIERLIERIVRLS